MNEQDLKFIDEHLYRRFLHFMDSCDASELAAAIKGRIAEDVRETADAEFWHSGDIDMALARLLMKTFVEG